MFTIKKSYDASFSLSKYDLLKMFTGHKFENILNILKILG